MTKEQQEKFTKDLEELCRMQKEGKFGKPLDTGNYSWDLMWLDALVQTQDSPFGPI